MGRLLGVAFAILLAAELALLTLVLAVVALFPYALWQQPDPGRARLALVAFVSFREFPLAGLFMVSLVGLLGAPVLIWVRSRRRPLTIAPYSIPEP